MKRNLVYAAAVVLTIVNLTGLATLLYSRWTGAAAPAAGDVRDQRFAQLKAQLDLSPDQAAQLGTFRTAFHVRIDSLSSRLVTARTGLANAILGDTVDTAHMDSTLQEIGRLQASAQKEVLSHLLSVKSILTPEQRERFTSIVLERFSAATERPHAMSPAH
jgi:Spy/CpxP family protein refolding chaperone